MYSVIAFDKMFPANSPHPLIGDAPVYAEKHPKIKFISSWEGQEFEGNSLDSQYKPELF
jgi:hypothetical protein